MNFFERRRTLKAAKGLLRQARHVRNMRGDLLTVGEVKRLDAGETAVIASRKSCDVEALRADCEALHVVLMDLMPPGRHEWMRENVEILIVALTVAMACRTYFIQPFKIPTGSMQPTLYGIQAETKRMPGVSDRFPLKLGTWLAYGEWYTEIRARESGLLRKAENDPEFDPSEWYYYIGRSRYKLPRHVAPFHEPGTFVNAGDILWSGIRTAGDHVFVDKVRWNFFPPRRGQIMVFSTDGIPTIRQGTHYIKRLVGLPGERMAVKPPHIEVNGDLLESPRSIAAVAYTALNTQQWPPQLIRGVYMPGPGVARELDSRSYLALGDNTGNSKDSRYWGPVPQQNLVGPAFFVYWPFLNRLQTPGRATRWGPIIDR